MNRSAVALAILLACVVVAPPSDARAASPTEELRGHINQVLGVLRDAPLRRPDASPQRRAAVREVVHGVLDLSAMAERALGAHWAARSLEERSEFVRLFGDVLESVYVAEMERHGDHTIAYLGESVTGADATVQTNVTGKAETRVDYRMHLRNGRWLVYDVLIGGLSVVENFRSQLQRILRDASYAGLVEKLREAAGGQAAGGAGPR